MPYPLPSRLQFRIINFSPVRGNKLEVKLLHKWPSRDLSWLSLRQSITFSFPRWQVPSWQRFTESSQTLLGSSFILWVPWCKLHEGRELVRLCHRHITTPSNVQAHHNHSGDYCYKEEVWERRRVERSEERKSHPRHVEDVLSVLSNVEKPNQCSSLELLLVSTFNTQVGRNLINITELSPPLLTFRVLTGLPWSHTSL